jgi:hypothetical protein
MKRDIEKLVTYEGLSALVGLPVRTLRTLKYQNKIPYIALGHRLIRFNPVHVAEAIRRREIREI